MLLQPNHNKFGLYKEKAGLKLLPPQEGLICNLDMEKIVGTTVYDRTGNGYDGAIINSTQSTGIRDLNTSLYLNTVSTGATFPNPYTYNTSYEIWFKVVQGHNGNLLHYSSKPADIIEFYNDTTYPNSIWIWLRFDGGSAYLGPVNINNFYENDKWCHLVLTWNGAITASSVKVYKNGEIAATYNTSYTKQATTTLTYNLQSNANTGEVSLGVLRKWNRVLSDKEIKYLYNNGYGIK